MIAWTPGVCTEREATTTAATIRLVVIAKRSSIVDESLEKQFTLQAPASSSNSRAVRFISFRQELGNNETFPGCFNLKGRQATIAIASQRQRQGESCTASV